MNGKMKKVVIGIAIVVAIVLVIGFVPLMDVPYQDTETYYVDEPYQDVETYTETELVPQVEILEHHMDIVGDVLWILGKVKNSSNITFATLDVSIHAICPVRDVEDSYYAKSVVLDYPVAFKPGEVRDFSATFDRNLVEDSYSLKIYQPLAEIVVEKERTVTKYRQVERERAVTRYKKGSIFEYLHSRC
jgi:hypothetical protein